MKQARDEWRVVLLAVGSGGAGLLALATATSSVLYAVLGAWVLPKGAEPTDTLSLLVVSSGVIVLAAIMLVTAFRALLVLKGQTNPSFASPAVAPRSAIVLLLLWLAASLLGQLIIDREPWKWSAPLLHLVAILAPVYLLSRLAIGGLRGGSRLRLWGTLTTGLTLGTGSAVIAEVAALLLGALLAGAYLMANPEQLQSVERLSRQLRQGPSIQDVLPIVAPILKHPLTLVVALIALSGITPMVEEVAKSASSWAIYDRLDTAAQGFWSGALGGVGFALFEGLMASADVTDGWGFVLWIRGVSSLMHILAAACAGWGIGAFRNGRKWTHLIGGYAAAIGLHALWNGSVVFIAYGGFRAVAGGNAADPVGLVSITVGGSALVLLIGLLPVVLVLLNRLIKTHQTELPVPVTPVSEERHPTPVAEG